MSNRAPLGPDVPSTASRLPNGQLKDTPANRALHPIETPQAAFGSETLQDRAYYADDRSLVFHGDVSKVLQVLANEGLEVDCIVTSPPFYGQRDYGVDGQIGLEQHPQEFVDALVEVFELCRPVLKDTGSMWVNLGDTYWSGKGAHKSNEAKQGARRFGVRPQDLPGDGGWARPKQLLLIPHRFAIAMQDAGWLIRNDNVWVKPNPIPDQVRDRSSISHEYVFHMTKERWYYYDREPVGRLSTNGRTLPPLDTWVVRPSRGSKKHKASFSEELVRIPVLATTPANGVVLDPFGGSGTTLRFARKNGFRSIGIDLNGDYCEEMADSLREIAASED
ncbi:site-specific DNA-methyltransferase [Gordonia amicalis]|uniref:Methyltransferase n=1 Tax=Gordonia amicalis TaxID=89053 RepID=A0AAE4RA71_9ACTN|nr:site-specific DNA-methyltransferase [Gordonia amicalis]MDV6314592.1 site-specific DNA-methyltransferase [Gordonia amicalis]